MVLFHPQRVHLTSRGIGKIVGDCEAEVLDVLWTSRRGSVRSVVEALRQKGRHISFNATMTIMNRLVAKGLLSKDKGEHGRYLYAPTVDRETFLRRMSKEVFQTVFRDPALFNMTGFADALASLSKKDRSTLRKLLGT